MSNLTALRYWKSKLNVAEARVFDAEEARDDARREMGEVLMQCREAEQLSLRSVAAHVMCSAPMLHDIEHGRRWSEGIVCRAVDFYVRRMEARVRSGDDPGCPAGDTECVSRADECHDACEAPHA